MSNSQQSPRYRGPNNVAQLQAHNEGLSVWMGLDELLAECNALRVSPSNALILIRNKELVKRAVKDSKGLLAAVEVLNNDMQAYKVRLDAIHAKHVELARSQQGNPTLVQEDLLAAVLSIAEEYSEWIASYQLVVIPGAFNVTGFFEPADVTASITLPTPAAVATPELSSL
ncbi:hypothetical protein D3C78_1083290 [compost metagenome]